MFFLSLSLSLSLSVSPSLEIYFAVVVVFIFVVLVVGRRRKLGTAAPVCEKGPNGSKKPRILFRHWSAFGRLESVEIVPVDVLNIGTGSNERNESISGVH